MTDPQPSLFSGRPARGPKYRALRDAVQRPHTRRTDPATSRSAEHAHRESGAMLSHAERVFRAVAARPGSTYRELAHAMPGLGLGAMDPTEVMRRLGTLERAGRVRKGAARACGAGGRASSTWYEVTD